MIKIQSTITKTGDKLSITDKSITINDIEYLKDNLYTPKHEEGEILPPIYLDGEEIIFNHKTDKTRRHITFINHLGNDKRFLDKNMNGLVDWNELIDYVNFYNMTDAEQLKMLSDIKKSFIDKKVSEDLTLVEAEKEWIAKGVVNGK